MSSGDSWVKIYKHWPLNTLLCAWLTYVCSVRSTFISISTFQPCCQTTKALPVCDRINHPCWWPLTDIRTVFSAQASGKRLFMSSSLSMEKICWALITCLYGIPERKMLFVLFICENSWMKLLAGYEKVLPKFCLFIYFLIYEHFCMCFLCFTLADSKVRFVRIIFQFLHFLKFICLFLSSLWQFGIYFFRIRFETGGKSLKEKFAICIFQSFFLIFNRKFWHVNFFYFSAGSLFKVLGQPWIKTMKHKPL